MASKNNEVTGWAGWAAFAGVLMVLAGFFQALVGVSAIVKNTVYFVGPYNILTVDIASWGWVHLLLALAILFAGLSVLKGNAYGRVVGVLLAGISALVNMAFIPAYPIWSILVMTVDVLIIYALVVHGDELKEA